MDPKTMEPEAFWGSTSHYHFRISLRVRHPNADPARITDALGITPNGSWQAGRPRQAPSGAPLPGLNRDTYWYASVLAGRHPESDMNAAIGKVLDRTARFRDFFHAIRLEGGCVELFIGWFFEHQSGGVLTHTNLGKAAELQMDLSFDVYPPTQPQNEYEIAESVLPM